MRHLNPSAVPRDRKAAILAACSAFNRLIFTVGDSVTLQHVIVDSQVKNNPADLRYVHRLIVGTLFRGFRVDVRCRSLAPRT
jgi:hypothetical protein